jgi:hypothetical protein
MEHGAERAICWEGSNSAIECFGKITDHCGSSIGGRGTAQGKFHRCGESVPYHNYFLFP